MIKVKVTLKNGCYADFESKGHAGFAEQGEDIVCAAVSALIINAFNSIEKFTEDAFEEEQDDGYVHVSFPGPPSKDAALLMDSLVYGLRQIEESSGSQFLKVKIREV